MRPPKLDTIIIGAFLLCVGLWMMSKCKDSRSKYLDRVARTENGSEQEDRPVRRDTITLAPTPTPTPNPAVTAPTVTPAPVTVATPAPTTITKTPVKTGETPAAPTTTTTTTPPKPTTNSTATTKPAGTTLFVTIDGLKVRKEPGLKSTTVATLDLYEQVTFLNERTDWTQEISLGYEKVTDHWVKVRTKAGKTGWVFGAGVNYYKEKRKGVME
jgi:hypothetical protein